MDMAIKLCKTSDMMKLEHHVASYICYDFIFFFHMLVRLQFPIYNKISVLKTISLCRKSKNPNSKLSNK